MWDVTVCGGRKKREDHTIVINFSLSGSGFPVKKIRIIKNFQMIMVKTKKILFSLTSQKTQKKLLLYLPRNPYFLFFFFN